MGQPLDHMVKSNMCEEEPRPGVEMEDELQEDELMVAMFPERQDLYGIPGLGMRWTVRNVLCPWNIHDVINT